MARTTAAAHRKIGALGHAASNWSFAYADCVRCGAPTTVQVADLCHLLHSLGAARLARTLGCYAACRDPEDGKPCFV